MPLLWHCLQQQKLSATEFFFKNLKECRRCLDTLVFFAKSFLNRPIYYQEKDKFSNNRVLRLPAIVLLNTNVVFNKTIAGRRRTLLLNVKPARMSVKRQILVYRQSRWHSHRVGLLQQSLSASSKIYFAGRRQTLWLKTNSV